MRHFALLLLAGAIATSVAAAPAGARNAADVVIGPARIAGGGSPCLAACIGRRLEQSRPGSAAAVWCSYGGGAQWGCLTMLVDAAGSPECRQLAVGASGAVLDSRPSACPIRLEQPMSVHTK